MSKFTISTKMNYPVEEIFNAFISICKKDFNKFNIENPIGAKYKRMVSKSKHSTLYMENQITDYEKNKVYEVTGTLANSKYLSRYEFKMMNEGCTEITLTESQEISGIFNKISFIFQLITVKSKLKKKLNNTIKILEESILKSRRKLENKK